MAMTYYAKTGETDYVPPIVLVPAYFWDNMRNHGLPIDAVSDYQVLRKHFGTQDITTLFVTQELSRSFPIDISRNILSEDDKASGCRYKLMEEWLERTHDVSKRAELRAVLDVALNTVSERVIEIKDMMVMQASQTGGPNETVADENEDFIFNYKSCILHSNGILFILLDGGVYLDYDKDAVMTRYKLLSNILKALYSFNLIGTVNNTSLFRDYVDVLEKV